MKLIDVLNTVTESIAQHSNRSITETLKKVDGKWALVSKTTGRPLQYYHGHGRPSDEWVKKVERRIHAFEGIVEGEGDPEGLNHISKELLQHIVTQIDTEGAHAIVKSLEWGDGASRELLQLIKRDLEKHIKTIDEGEGDPEGIPHLTKSFLKNILNGVDEEGAYSIVKSLQWGDGAAKELLELITKCLRNHISMRESVKQRLDPSCWPKKHIGKPATKIKGGVRVNNCVPNEGMTEALTLDEQFDIIEEMVGQVAAKHGVDPELIWEDFEVVDDATLLETAAWKRKEGKNKTGGLNAKGIASYRKENPGSKLQAAVTTKPSKLKPGSKAAKRRKSFCARMSGMEGPMKDEHGKPTRKALALRKWNC